MLLARKCNYHTCASRLRMAFVNAIRAQALRFL